MQVARQCMLLSGIYLFEPCFPFEQPQKTVCCRDARQPEAGEVMLLARVEAALRRRRFALAASLHQDLAMDALAEVWHSCQVSGMECCNGIAG